MHRFSPIRSTLLPLCLILGIALAATGCSEQAAPEPNADAFELSDPSEALVKATYDGGPVGVAFESRRTGDGTAEGSVTVGDLTLSLSVDFNTPTLRTQTHDARLSPAQKESLRLFVSKLQGATDAPLPRHAQMAARVVSYWSEAPMGHTLRSRSVAPSAKFDEGVTCIQRGTDVVARYDDDRVNNASPGRVSYDLVRVGSTARPGYECMGRCGPGCQPWYAVDSAWCKDCLDHDQCSNVYFASGGSSDDRCGDEYDEAFDDWTWGLSYGCTG